jgi:cytochrome c553
MLGKRSIGCLAVLALGAFGLSAFGAMAETAQPGPSPMAAPDGAAIASNCYICHGYRGISPSPIPALAGLPKEDIQLKLQEFKSGQRQATIMDRIAKGYTDEQIAAVAAYLAAQR